MTRLPGLLLLAFLATALITAGAGSTQQAAELAGCELVGQRANGETVWICPPVEPPTATATATETPTATATEQPTATATATATAAPPAPAVFLETFTQDVDAPQAPAPFYDDRWQRIVHTRDRGEWNVMDAMQAGHGDDCAAPPATHLVDSFEQAIFRCRDHVMTAINSTSYGVVYLAPAALVDFADGATIAWDMSTLRASPDRDWVDLWIMPLADNLILPLQQSFPDLAGYPRRAVMVRLQATRNTFEVYVVRDFEPVLVARPRNDWTAWLTPSASRREAFRVELSPTSVHVTMPEYDRVLATATFPALDWTAGAVMFGHHSYNPFKSCEAGAPDCGPGTWHWDNVRIEPAIPFTIIDVPGYFQTAQDAATLARPATANAFLRFSAIGPNVEFSVDGGETWTVAHKQEASDPNTGHFESYWTPIPAGTTSIRFRGVPWYGGGWRVRNVAVWAD